MPTSEAQKRASAKWNSSRDNITIRVDKETGRAIRAAAASLYGDDGALTKYILKAVQAAMNGQSADTATPNSSVGGVAGAVEIDLAAIGEHIERPGETIQAFITRAVKDEIDRDNRSFMLGVKPATAPKE